MTTNPFAPPQSSVSDIDISQQEDMPSLWNPNAAANWSLLFSPAFGAFLHMKNWQALGEPEKAAAAKVWFIGTLLVVFGLSFLTVLFPTSKVLGSIPNSIGLVLVLSWYFSSGKAQAKYVTERFGKTYPRNGWGKPLGVAILVTLGFIISLSILAVIGARLAGKV
jgi:hypothetical protein